jgi:hypothetical protein
LSLNTQYEYPGSALAGGLVVLPNQRCMLNMLRRWGLPHARDVSGLLTRRHIKLMCLPECYRVPRGCMAELYIEVGDTADEVASSLTSGILEEANMLHTS